MVKFKNRLHWLRVPKHVTFKLHTLVYKWLHGSAPRYLAELCNPVASDSYRRNLRSAGKNELIVQRHNLSTYGPRSVGIAGPITWNWLPQHLRNDELSYERFLSGLKSHFFRISSTVSPKRYVSGMPGSKRYLLLLTCHEHIGVVYRDSQSLDVNQSS